MIARRRTPRDSNASGKANNKVVKSCAYRQKWLCRHKRYQFGGFVGCQTVNRSIAGTKDRNQVWFNRVKSVSTLSDLRHFGFLYKLWLCLAIWFGRKMFGWCSVNLILHPFNIWRFKTLYWYINVLIFEETIFSNIYIMNCIIYFLR